MDGQNETKPGFGFVERYMPHASAAEREAAYENFCAFVNAILRVAMRIAMEKHANEIRVKDVRAIELVDETSRPP